MPKGNINHYQKYYSSYRFFSCSSFKKTTQLKINKVYNYLSKFEPQLMDIFKKSTLPLYFTLELYMEKNINFTYDITIIKTINIKKVNKKIEELTQLKKKNWELVHSLEKITDLDIFMNKIHQSHITQNLKNTIQEYYISLIPLLSLLIDTELIHSLLTRLKEKIEEVTSGEDKTNFNSHMAKKVLGEEDSFIGIDGINITINPNTNIAENIPISPKK